MMAAQGRDLSGLRADARPEAGRSTAAAYLPAVTGYYTDLDGNMLSFPFNASTPILYYNKDQFRLGAGSIPNAAPNTWPRSSVGREMLRAAGACLRLHHALAVLDQYREFLRLHNMPLATKANGFGGLGRRIDVQQPGRDATHRGSWPNGRRPRCSIMAAAATQAEPQLPEGRMRHLHRLVGDARRHPSPIPSSRSATACCPIGPMWPARRRTRIIGGATLWVLQRPAAGRIHRRRQILRLSVTAGGAGGVASEHRLSADHARRLRAHPREQGFYDRNPGAAISIEQIDAESADREFEGPAARLLRVVTVRDTIEEEMELALTGKKSAQAALDDAVRRGNDLLAAIRARQPLECRPYARRNDTMTYQFEFGDVLQAWPELLNGAVTTLCCPPPRWAIGLVVVVLGALV